MHVAWNYLLVVKLDQGVIGTGIAACLTNAFILAGNIHVTNIQPSLKEALDVKLFDPKVFENIYQYLQIGFPSMVIMFLDWTSFQILSMLSGYIGVTEQACQIILWNIMSLAW
jgi:Na+-driven multidrug efflux pump